MEDTRGKILYIHIYKNVHYTVEVYAVIFLLLCPGGFSPQHELRPLLSKGLRSHVRHKVNLGCEYIVYAW